MKRTLIVSTVGCCAAVSALIGWHVRPMTAQTTPAVAAPIEAPAKPAKPQAAKLPVAQVVLFSSGVGYFQREGEVEGNTRVEMAFATNDINDLLKSLVLQDLGGGKITTISYDSFDPIDRTLRSFALDLTSNPSFGELLNQARGEKIEVVLQQSNNTQPATMTGVILGMEARKGSAPNTERELLNLLCAEGLRSIPLEHIQRVRLLNPVLDSELHRALDVLATSHDMQKKTVSLAFTGDGKRAVRVGYVVENPLWKTSYRLVLGKDGKAALQGWAMVENTQDEDWNNVRMVLISGRPISFEMDLYQPLYVPRPKVEPEQFASLRPPTYNGAMEAGNQAVPAVAGAGGVAMNPMQFMGGNPGQLGFINRYQLGGQFGNLGGQFGQQGGGNAFGLMNGDQRNRLSYQELQQRKLELKDAKASAGKVGSALAGFSANGAQVLGPGGIPEEAATTADDLGDYVQYAIDHKVSLPRQKSAMIPIIDRPVAGTRVSIFNEAVQAKHPLHGVKLKNTTGQHLMQGPISVYENGNYAGDTRVLDVQPNEERLVSFAVDLGMEVKAESKSAPEQLVAVKLVKGVLQVSHKLRQTRTYLVKNRAPEGRTLIIEHPIHTDWKLVAPEKPTERSRDMYRFQLEVPAGKGLKHDVVEEFVRASRIELTGIEESAMTVFITNSASSPAVKEALKKAVDLRHGLADTKKEIAQLEGRLKAIGDDQTRLRANLDKVPPTSAAHKRYLEKFDAQETEIEKLQEKLTQKQELLEKQQKEYENYLVSLSAE